jgi:hypothetical protein
MDMLRRSSMALTVTLMVAAPACAQVSRTAPSVNCSGVFESTVASGRRHPHFDSCSGDIVPQVVKVLGEAPLHPQSSYLTRLLTYSSPYRDPAIATASLSLAQNAAAPESAQLLGWFLATSQLRRSLYLQSLGYSTEAWFTSNATSCNWGEPTDSGHSHDNGLPSEYVRDLQRAAEVVAQDASRPARVRHYAGCLLQLLPALSDSTDES